MFQRGILFLLVVIIFLILTIWFFADKKPDVGFIMILLCACYTIASISCFDSPISDTIIENESDMKKVLDTEPEYDYFIVDKNVLLEYIKMNDNRDKDREKYDRVLNSPNVTLMDDIEKANNKMIFDSLLKSGELDKYIKNKCLINI